MGELGPMPALKYLVAIGGPGDLIGLHKVWLDLPNWERNQGSWRSGVLALRD